MIFDITGIEIIPGNHGKNCPGNGETYDENHHLIECCCDECDLFLECFPEFIPQKFHTNQKGTSE